MLEAGFGDPGEDPMSDAFDYSEFGIQTATFQRPDNYEAQQGSYKTEAPDGASSISHYQKWHPVIVPDDFIIPTEYDNGYFSEGWTASADHQSAALSGISWSDGQVTFDGSSYTFSDALDLFKSGVGNAFDSVAGWVADELGVKDIYDTAQNVETVAQSLIHLQSDGIDTINALMNDTLTPAQIESLMDNYINGAQAEVDQAAHDLGDVPGAVADILSGERLSERFSINGDTGQVVASSIQVQIEADGHGEGYQGEVLGWVDATTGEFIPPESRDFVLDGSGDSIIDTTDSQSISDLATRDIVSGGGGNDSIWTGRGTDIVLGGDGNDFIAGGSGSDVIDGGPGTDTVDLGGLYGGGFSLFQVNGTVYSLDANDHSYDTVTNVESFQGGGQTVALSGIDAFDPLVYIASNADLIQAFHGGTEAQLAAEGLSHYISNGYAEGRPTDFDVNQYLANYGDLRANLPDGHGGYDAEAALAHYIDYGYFEHRLWQDPLDYIASNADLIKGFHGGSEAELEAEGLAHYQAHGYAEGRVIDFDASQYLANYSDLSADFSDGHGGYDDDAALAHYINYGYFEHRLSQDPLAYIASNVDLIKGFQGGSEAELKAEGLAHYQTHGYAEGRVIDFDAGQYLANYGDLRANLPDGHGGYDDDAAIAHYIDYGYSEHRLWQDPLDYIASNVDLIKSFQGGSEAELEAEGLAHYQTHGYAEARAIDFDVAQYLANYSDLRTAFADGHGGYDYDAALTHYIDHGYLEGRTDHVLTA
jgi:hypothetical protein